MKYLVLVLVIVAAQSLGCAPSEQSQPTPEPTPTAAAGDQITDLDFESGDVDESAVASEEPAQEPTPEAP